MKGKLSFAQRLARESVSVEKNVVGPPSSIEKSTGVKTEPQKTRYMQFKQQHNELKNMLKLFQQPRLEISPELVSASPTRSRKIDKKQEVTPLNVMPSKLNIIKKQPMKEHIYEPKWSKSIREDYRPNVSTILPKTSPTMAFNTDSHTPSKVDRAKKKGIPNTGSTCYINALVQCLFHLPHFNDYFADQKYKSERNGKNKDIVQIYRDLYMSVIKNSQKAEISTLPLKKSVSKICSLFIDWEQQDAHEFMKELINSMHEDLNRVDSKPSYKEMAKEMEGVAIEKMAGMYWEYQKKRDNSYIYDSFCGQIYNSIRCINCNFQSQGFQNFLDLSVPIVNGARSLEDLLENYFQPEKLSDFYLCGKCNKSAKKSVKTVQLWRAPKFLIIQLKRSQFGKKNTDPIKIPDSLSLKNYMTLSNDRSAKYCQYSLSSVIMHRGVIQGGHYWCNVKQSGKWFQMDDQKVTEPSSEQFKAELSKRGSSNAYILFYTSLYS